MMPKLVSWWPPKLFQSSFFSFVCALSFVSLHVLVDPLFTPSTRSSYLDAIDATEDFIRPPRHHTLGQKISASRPDIRASGWRTATARAVDEKLDISILLRHANIRVDDVERLLDLLDVAVHRRGQLRVLAPSYLLLD